MRIKKIDWLGVAVHLFVLVSVRGLVIAAPKGDCDDTAIWLFNCAYGLYNVYRYWRL